MYVDITFLIFAVLLGLILILGCAILTYMCCRAIDKCMSRSQLFHHDRGFISMHDIRGDPVQQTSSTNPFISNPTSPTQHSTLRSQATPGSARKVTTFVVPDQPLIQVVDGQQVLEVHNIYDVPYVTSAS